MTAANLTTHAEESTAQSTYPTGHEVSTEHTAASEHAATTEHHAGPHISIKAEPVFYIGNFPVTNSILLSYIVLATFLVMVLKYNADSKKQAKSSFYYFVTFVMRGVYDLFHSTLADNIVRFFPLIGAFFFYILLNNWSGLLPGVGSILYNGSPLFRANTADLNTTIALALIIMVYIQVVGIRAQGAKGYSKKFINFVSPIAFFVGILEIVSEISRILSFSFRLFGNIFAGEVLLVVVAFLIPVAASFPFLLLETFVGIIQAVVFAMLSAVLIKLAISEHH